mmetsp:Transcript_28887/g.30041  ORF Transcript_28887/g.30041 Transcript_28887/m.30041 type:complete len:457 (-) Transcript_28887:75-1445(-)
MSIKTENIFDIINELNYLSKDEIVFRIMTLQSLDPNFELYKTHGQESSNSKIVVIKKTFQIQLSNKNKYPVSVLIYLDEKFPASPPTAYLFIDTSVDIRSIVVNANNPHISKDSFELRTEKLLYWDSNILLLDLCQEIEDSFKKNFPVVKSKEKVNNTPHRKCYLNILSKVSVVSQNNHNKSNKGSLGGGGAIGGGNNFNSNFVNPQNRNNSISNPSKPNLIKDINDLFGDLQVNDDSKGNQNKIVVKAQKSSLSNNNNNNNSNSSNKPKASIIQDSNILESVFENQNLMDDQLKQILKNEILHACEAQYSSRIQPRNDLAIKLSKEMNDLKAASSQILTTKDKINNFCNILRQRVEACENTHKEIQLRNINNNNQGGMVNTESLAAMISEIGLSNNGELISLISIEMSIEELIVIVKKAYERKEQDFDSAVKLVRTLTKEAFKVKKLREKITGVK